MITHVPSEEERKLIPLSVMAEDITKRLTLEGYARHKEVYDNLAGMLANKMVSLNMQHREP